MKRSLLLAMFFFGVSITISACGSSSNEVANEVTNSKNEVLGIKLTRPNEFQRKENEQIKFPSTDELKGSVQDRYTSKQMSIKELILTPQKGGMFVYATGGGGMTLDLYGLENPNEPKYEGSIYNDVDVYASNIKMLGNGIIQYDLKDIYSHGEKTRVKYDYFDGKIISKEKIGGDGLSDRDSLTPQMVKDMIQKSYGEKIRSVSKVVLTPSKYGAIVYSRGPGFMYLDLYGLDDINHPKKEYSIYSSDDDDHIENIKMIGDGIVQYDIRGNYMHDEIKRVKYDYFHHKELSSQIIKV